MNSIKDKNFLLHTCCAPCATYVLAALQDDGAKITSFFYNPNIHGKGEYEIRKKSLEGYVKKIDIPLIIPPYNMRDYFDAIYDYEKEHYKKIEHDKRKRCDICFQLRLKKTALAAKKDNFDFFSTTLLVSPFQDQSRIWQIGAEIGEEIGVPFYFRDFRKGYLESRHKAKRYDLYMQNYCGCSYSVDERVKE